MVAFHENLFNPSSPKGGNQTMLRVPLVVCEILPGCTRTIYFGLLEIRQNNSRWSKRIF